ncbi:MAG TPA: response regulator [Rectinemataceae bacterium]|nr:response regulator [Rectinemataceae bacterium]
MDEEPAPETAELLSILVADDEEGMREGMKRILEKRGHRVELAENGARAIEKLDSGSYDLVLVDLRMPEVDGFAVTDYVVRKKGGRTVVVIVSALATVEAAVETTRKGAFDFLVKPFAPDDLLRVVERAAGQARLLRERDKYLVELDGERSLSRLLINSLREGVIVFNLRGETVLLNPRAELLLGMRYRSGGSCSDFPFEPGCADSVRSVLAGETGERSLTEEVGGRHLQIRVTPYLRGAEIGGAIVLLHDITEEWETERDKDRFVSMVAHELRGPLAAIVSYLDIVLEGGDDGDREREREILRRSKLRGEALLELIDDLQYLNKSKAGKTEKTIETLDLAEVLREEAAFVAGQAEHAAVKLSVQAAKGVFTFAADRSDLDRIFLNLMFNGIKYNVPDGRLDIALRESEDGRWLEIAFADTGIGMDEEEMKSLFQDFYRIKNERTRAIPGTGLGLATAKRALAEYNGRIEVSSAPGKGSTFTVILPR